MASQAGFWNIHFKYRLTSFNTHVGMHKSDRIIDEVRSSVSLDRTSYVIAAQAL